LTSGDDLADIQSVVILQHTKKTAGHSSQHTIDISAWWNGPSCNKLIRNRSTGCSFTVLLALMCLAR
jgi:hypothetical protein